MDGHSTTKSWRCLFSVMTNLKGFYFHLYLYLSLLVIPGILKQTQDKQRMQELQKTKEGKKQIGQAKDARIAKN